MPPKNQSTQQPAGNKSNNNATSAPVVVVASKPKENHRPENVAAAPQQEQHKDPNNNNNTTTAVAAAPSSQQNQQEQQQQRNRSTSNKRQNQNQNQQPLSPEEIAARRAYKIDLVRKQLEFFFSPENLTYDHFLASSLSSKRLMPLDALAQFPKMREIHASPALIVEACQKTNKVTLELSRESHTYWIGPAVPGCHPNQATLILREVPPHVHQTEVFTRLQESIAPFGSVLESVAPASKHNGTWFLNFFDGESARRCLSALTGRPSLWRPETNTVIRFKEASSTGAVRSIFCPVPYTLANPARGNMPHNFQYTNRQLDALAAPGHYDQNNYNNNNNNNGSSAGAVADGSATTQQDQDNNNSNNRSRSKSQGNKNNNPQMVRGGRGGRFSGRGRGASSNRPGSRHQSQGNKNNNTNNATNDSKNSSRRGSGSSGRRSPLAEAFLAPFPGQTEVATPTNKKSGDDEIKTNGVKLNNNNKNKKQDIVLPSSPFKSFEMPPLGGDENTTSTTSNTQVRSASSANVDYRALFAKKNGTGSESATAPAVAPAKNEQPKPNEEEEDHQQSNKSQQQKSVTVADSPDVIVENKTKQDSPAARSQSNENNNNRPRSNNNRTTTSRNFVPHHYNQQHQNHHHHNHSTLGGPHLSLVFGEGNSSYMNDFKEYFQAVAHFNVLPPQIKSQLDAHNNKNNNNNKNDDQEKKENTAVVNSTAEVQHHIPSHAVGGPQQQQQQQQQQPNNGGGSDVPLSEQEYALLNRLWSQHQRSLGYTQNFMNSHQPVQGQNVTASYYNNNNNNNQQQHGVAQFPTHRNHFQQHQHQKQNNNNHSSNNNGTSFDYHTFASSQQQNGASNGHDLNKNRVMNKPAPTTENGNTTTSTSGTGK